MKEIEPITRMPESIPAPHVTIAQQVALAQEVAKNPGLQIVLESFAKHFAPAKKEENKRPQQIST